MFNRAKRAYNINVQPRASRAKPHPNKVFMLCYRPRIICY